MESVTPSMVVGGSCDGSDQRPSRMDDESGQRLDAMACQRTEEASSSLRPKNWIWFTFLSVSEQR